ncbi:PQQ-binding-like beta-propeller repeat protein [Streptomyces sp. NPDC050263]|uniref:serine/threonine-protein kinase n=1 Tax=Streptomyces sp. NPDC050263 TaxID=3155037 RepID=UPI00343DBACC
MPLSTGTGEPESAASIGGYLLFDRLGSGGMGVVHLGRSASGRQVAVKVVHAQYAQDEEFRARFRQEVAAARRVSGAFTAPVVDADPDAEVPWMATLYVPGRTLAELIAEQGPLDGRALRTLALGLVEALRDIHQAGVVHRDLKPSNVLMAEDGPRVIDFGISRAADNQTLTVTGRLIGTPPFMSPEQFTSPRDVTAASDVFSLGSLLVFAATGNRPFDGESPYLTGYQVMHEPPTLDGVAEPLRSIVARCLAKEAADRPRLPELHRLFRSLPDGRAAFLASAEDAGVATHVEGGKGGKGGRGGRGGRGGNGVRRKRWPRRLLVVGAALAVAAVAGVAVSEWLAEPTEAGSAENASAQQTSAAASPAPALPAGWRPWRAGLTRAVQPKDQDRLVTDDEPGCVPAGTALYCAGAGFTVAKLDAATGRVEWRFGVSPQITRPIGVHDGVVYVYEKPDSETVRWRLVAVDADTGKKRWAREISETQPAVLFDGGILAMSPADTELLSIDTRTGEDMSVASADSSSGSACRPLALGGAPYALCTDAKDDTKGTWSLLSINPSEGIARELTRLPVGSVPLGVVGGQPLFATLPDTESLTVVGLDEPYSALLRVDPESGAIKRTALADSPRGTVTLADGVVCFVRPDGTVTALRATDGVRLWQQNTQVENLSTPVLSKTYDTLFLANRYGRLLALDRRTGAVRWTTDKLDAPGDSAQSIQPQVTLAKDAIVAVAGDTAFSVRPDRPTAVATATVAATATN